MTEYIDLRSTTVESIKQLHAAGYGWLYAIYNSNPLGSIEIDLSRVKSHIVGFRMSTTGRGADALMIEGGQIVVGRPISARKLRNNQTEVRSDCVRLVLAKQRFENINNLLVFYRDSGKQEAMTASGVTLVETFDPLAFASKGKVYLYGTTNNQVYEISKITYALYKCTEMLLTRDNFEPAFYITVPPTTENKMSGYKITSTEQERSFARPPFEHVIVSKNPLTAKDIREMLSLFGRHEPKRPKPRDP